MDSQMYQNLRRLINCVDELRDVGLQKYINLPRVCVVGTQSAGKSSVLEAIVGLDFLPRGDGVVTRRPLELRLVHLSETEHSIETAWAVFDNDPAKKLTDFEKVKQEIDRLTEQRAGSNKGIVDDPILLTIYATRCPDLTLIDLPGIARVPLKDSDQTGDIEKLTREMAMRYAQDPRTLILAVTPANQDTATSDALLLASKVDPKGFRTLGVITKVDLMDRGTDAARTLRGDDFRLHLGYTAVINRSQEDIRNSKPISKALEDEKAFFASHPVYKTLPPAMLGTNNLIQKLTQVLFRHIRQYLPEIKREISNKMRESGDRLSELGEGVPVDLNEKVHLVWTMVTDFCEIHKNNIRGKYDKRLHSYFDCDISGGAHIRSVFNELLDDYVDKNVTEEMTDYDIDAAIRMHEGDSLPGFPSPDTFEYLILPHLKKIQNPVMECLDRVSQCLESLSQKVANRVFSRFPRLAEQVIDQTMTILARERENTKVILENTVASEIGYLFTNDQSYLALHGSTVPSTQEPSKVAPSSNQHPHHPQIMGMANEVSGQQDPQAQQGQAGRTSASQLISTMGQSVQSMQQQVSSLWAKEEEQKKKIRYSESFIQEIRARLDAYFNIVLRNIRDTVPKVIGYFLVRQIQDKLQFELYNELNRADKLADLLGEPPHIMDERRTLTAQLDTLKRASYVLQRDPNITALNNEAIDSEYDAHIKLTARAHPQSSSQPHASRSQERPARNSGGGERLGLSDGSHYQRQHGQSGGPHSVVRQGDGSGQVQKQTSGKAIGLFGEEKASPSSGGFNLKGSVFDQSKRSGGGGQSQGVPNPLSSSS
eukprot:GHVN01096189.1.p1 GENE.GHVN01096189.1~~GHVN01096189.1.p1  ORF type:complete len:839 (-),score=148.11 GHVN01096189.1:1766-4237(-)